MAQQKLSENQASAAAVETRHLEAVQQMQVQTATLEKASAEQSQKLLKEKEVCIRPGLCTDVTLSAGITKGTG